VDTKQSAFQSLGHRCRPDQHDIIRYDIDEGRKNRIRSASYIAFVDTRTRPIRDYVKVGKGPREVALKAETNPCSTL
jgi:hypothetical protein